MYVEVQEKNGKVHAALKYSYRKDGRPATKYVANLSSLPEKEIRNLQYALKLKDKPVLKEIAAGSALQSSKSIGAVLALKHLAYKLGIKKALGRTPNAELILWLAISHLLGADSLRKAEYYRNVYAVEALTNENFSKKRLEGALDWLGNKQLEIEEKYLKEHEENLDSLFLYSLEFPSIRSAFTVFADSEGFPVSIKKKASDKWLFQRLLKGVKKKNNIVFVKDRYDPKILSEIEKSEAYYIAPVRPEEIHSLIKLGAINPNADASAKGAVMGKSRYAFWFSHDMRAMAGKLREKKLRVLRAMVKDANYYLARHLTEKSKAATAESIRSRIREFNMESFMDVRLENDVIELIRDKKQQKKVEELEGCVVLKTNILSDEISDEKICRYYFLNVNFKNFFFLPGEDVASASLLYRKDRRIRALLFVEMFAYILFKNLHQVWRDFDISADEGLKRLSNIVILNAKTKDGEKRLVPKPDDFCKKLLDAVGVELPESI